MLTALAAFAGLTAAALGVLLLRLYLYRFKSHVRHERTPDMESQPCEGYTDRYHYRPGDKVKLYISSEAPNVEITISHRLSSYAHRFQALATMQVSPREASAQGCHWDITAEYLLPQNAAQGYYDCTISNGVHSFSSPLLVTAPPASQPIALLAPVTTWTAYNAWGGQSLYDNVIDSENTYLVSSQRPNTAFMISHSLQTEQHIAEWFMQKYECALVPDLALDPAAGYFHQLESSRIIVLVFHCEYVSPEMYRGMKDLLKQGKSLILAGANNFYWKVRWHDNFTCLECHKDLTGFADPWSIGGLWKHSLRSGERQFGVRFTRHGYKTHAPFKVISPNHWLFEGTDQKAGDIFGEVGIAGKPICGVEMDRTTWLNGKAVLLARGLNRDAAGRDAGGHMTIRELSDHQGILALGSVHTGAGLGIDPVLTRIVENFVRRYGQ
jgi:N,N-dimethylformamidase